MYECFQIPKFLAIGQQLMFSLLSFWPLMYFSFVVDRPVAIGFSNIQKDANTCPISSQRLYKGTMDSSLEQVNCDPRYKKLRSRSLEW